MTALTAGNLGAVTVTLDDYVFADDDGVVVVAGRTSTESSRPRGTSPSREGAQAVRLLKGELLRTQFDLDDTSRNATPIPITRSVSTSRASAARLRSRIRNRTGIILFRRFSRPMRAGGCACSRTFATAFA